MPVLTKTQTQFQADRYFAECRRYCLGMSEEHHVTAAWRSLVESSGRSEVVALVEAEAAIQRFEKVGWS